MQMDLYGSMEQILPTLQVIFHYIQVLILGLTLQNYKKISNSTEDPYFYNKKLYSGVENSNFYENRFYSWKDFWTGRSKIEEQKNYNGKIDPYFWKKSENTQYTNNTNNIQSITLNSQINTQNSKSIEKKIFNKEVIPYSRRRNFTFVCDSLKPSTRFYPFLDKVSLSGFIIPKFIEITMISGSFSVGEKISGYVSAESSTQSNARFCCRSLHLEIISPEHIIHHQRFI